MQDSPSICSYLQLAVLLWGVGEFLIPWTIDGFIIAQRGFSNSVASSREIDCDKDLAWPEALRSLYGSSSYFFTALKMKTFNITNKGLRCFPEVFFLISPELQFLSSQ